MKRPFIEDLIELCDDKGYSVQTVGIEGDLVEVTIRNERGKRTKKSTIAKDFKITENAAM